MLLAVRDADATSDLSPPECTGCFSGSLTFHVATLDGREMRSSARATVATEQCRTAVTFASQGSIL
jgi:hypothetical protein